MRNVLIWFGVAYSVVGVSALLIMRVGDSSGRYAREQYVDMSLELLGRDVGAVKITAESAYSSTRLHRRIITESHPDWTNDGHR